jgi:hypothetical protein
MASESRWLELFYQADYRQPSAKVEVNTSAQAGEGQVVCEAATRKAMIAAREKFLAGPKNPPPHHYISAAFCSLILDLATGKVQT